MNNAKEMFWQAIDRLEVAHEELNRPDEDVMAISVCHQSRTILAEIMGSYLAFLGKDYSVARDLETLRRMSAEYDPRFGTLDLDSMVCHPTKMVGEPCYCLDLGRVRTCLAMADQCKAWVKEAIDKR